MIDAHARHLHREDGEAAGLFRRTPRADPARARQPEPAGSASSSGTRPWPKSHPTWQVSSSRQVFSP